MSPKGNKKQTLAGHGPRLNLEHYHKICGILHNWRIHNFIRAIEEKNDKGRILAFVRGLHFSAQLIYAIRELISEPNLNVDWGHLLDDSNTYCSRECDIIIYKGKYYGRWNGAENPIMDFKIIEKKSAIAVISCKSYLKSGAIDKEYVRYLKSFVKRIWLFAECCEPKHVEKIAQQAKDAGYEKFWYMYKWSCKTASCEYNEDGWLDFVTKLKKLKR